MRAPLRDVVRGRIYTLRTQRGLTQEALCERASISLDAVCRIENGTRCPTLDTLERIARALDVSVVDLLQTDALPEPRFGSATGRVIALFEAESPAVQRALEVVVHGALRVAREASNGRRRRARR